MSTSAPLMARVTCKFSSNPVAASTVLEESDIPVSGQPIVLHVCKQGSSRWARGWWTCLTLSTWSCTAGYKGTDWRAPQIGLLTRGDPRHSPKGPFPTEFVGLPCLQRTPALRCHLLILYPALLHCHILASYPALQGTSTLLCHLLVLHPALLHSHNFIVPCPARGLLPFSATPYHYALP